MLRLSAALAVKAAAKIDSEKRKERERKRWFMERQICREERKVTSFDAAFLLLWGAQAASLQEPAACRLHVGNAFTTSETECVSASCRDVQAGSLRSQSLLVRHHLARH